MSYILGKSTGIISNARITHATPAASYAHVASRNWEGDVDMKDVTGGCRDIAQQLIRENQRIKVNSQSFCNSSDLCFQTCFKTSLRIFNFYRADFYAAVSIGFLTFAPSKTRTHSGEKPNILMPA